jgi:hypothetical protein
MGHSASGQTYPEREWNFAPPASEAETLSVCLTAPNATTRKKAIVRNRAPLFAPYRTLNVGRNVGTQAHHGRKVVIFQ